MNNPVDFWNLNGTWDKSLRGVKEVEVVDEQIIMASIKGKKAKVQLTIREGMITFPKDATAQIDKEVPITRFMAYANFQFKGNYRAAMTHIEYTLLHKDVPYIRVGTDYFKVITKRDRYGVTRSVIKGWKSEAISRDHGQKYLNEVHLFDDFCIVPDNINYSLVVDNCYNVYAPFSHRPSGLKVTEAKFPVSMRLMNHIFGDQVELGLTYLKVLYLHPDRPLPILCLVSKERQTGKTTFLNWMQMIFGDNFIQINPEDLTSQFNSSYASKNIIALDETVIEKSHAVEKLKSIATAKSLSVNQKFVANYALPFYGKVILCTNKEKDFMRIDEEEIRFWVRKVKSIDTINTKIEYQLKDEITYFLKFLTDMPAVDFSKSRMVFTANQLKNDQLVSIQKESWSWLRKELFLFFEDLFNQDDSLESVKATSSDIKNKWFSHNNQVNSSYILKVLKEEMGLKQSDLVRFSAFDSDPMVKVRGRPFVFQRADFVNGKLLKNEIPF